MLLVYGHNALRTGSVIDSVRSQMSRMTYRRNSILIDLQAVQDISFLTLVLVSLVDALTHDIQARLFRVQVALKCRAARLLKVAVVLE